MDSLSPALAARSAVTATPVLARPLSDGESAHLDRLRDWLRRDGTDASDVAALDARWSRLLETHPPHVPAPAGVAAALGIAIGDLLVASVTDAVWMMCPGPEGATPGVLVQDRPHMPVLPVLDAHARWRVRSSGWAVDYLERAAAHLQQAAPRVPTQHASPEAPVVPPADEAAAPAAAASTAPPPSMTAVPTPYVPRTPTSGATWVPTAVPGASQPPSTPDATPDLRPVGWTTPGADAGEVASVEVASVEVASVEAASVEAASVDVPAEATVEEAPAVDVPAEATVEEAPAVVEQTAEVDEPTLGSVTGTTAEPAAAPWTPVLVEDDAPATAPETAAWTPTLVQDDAPAAPERTGWTPTFVEDAPPATDPAAAAWTPTFVEDAPPATEPEITGWTPTFVGEGEPESVVAEDHVSEDDVAPAPAWTPVLVEDDVEPAPAAPAWTPVLVADDDVPSPLPHAGVDEHDAPAAAASAVWTPVVVEDTAPDLEDAPADAPEPWRPVLVADDAPDDAPVPGPVDTTPTPGRGLPVTPQRELTPEDLPHRPSERVQDLALRALELALDRAVSDPAGCAPFVLVREQYDVEVLDFPHTDAGLSQARDAARAGGYTAAAVAWTSPADATRPFARVVVDASAAGRPGIRVAHSFAHDVHGSREVGGPQVVGQAAPVL